VLCLRYQVLVLLEQNLDVLNIPSNIDGALRTMLRRENKANILKAVLNPNSSFDHSRCPGSFYACLG
jgi:hypothetical protein